MAHRRLDGFDGDTGMTVSTRTGAFSPQRRRLLGGLGGLGALLVLPACTDGGGAGGGLSADATGMATGPQTWPMSSGNPAAWRLAAQPAGGLLEQWRLRLSGGVLGAPAVVDGVVYAASFFGEVVAANIVSGEEIWRQQFPTATYGDAITRVGSRGQAFYGGPAVRDGRVYVVSDRLWCLDAVDGTTIWSTQPLRSDASDDYFWGAPTLVEDTVLVGSGSGSELPRARGAVTAYDARSGALRWSTRTVPEGGNGGGLIAPVSVDLARRKVYAATGAPYEAVAGDNPGTTSLIEFDLDSGNITWQDQAHLGDDQQRDFNSSPVLVEDRAFATNKDGVWAWDRVSRERLWQTQLTPSSVAPGVVPSGPTDGPEGGPIAWSGRHVIAGSNDAGQASAVVAALEPDSGAVAWQTTLPGLIFAAMAVGDDRIYVSTASAVLYELDAASGAILGAAALAEPSSGAVTVAQGRVLVGTGAAPYLPGESLVCLG